MARATAEITLYQDKKAHEENRLKELQHCMAELTADELHANLVMGGPFAHRDLVKDTQLQEHMLQNRVAKVCACCYVNVIQGQDSPKVQKYN